MEEARDNANLGPALAPGLNPPNGCIDATIGGFFCAYALQHVTGKLGVSQAAVSRGLAALEDAPRQVKDTSRIASVSPRTAYFVAL